MSCTESVNHHKKYDKLTMF